MRFFVVFVVLCVLSGVAEAEPQADADSWAWAIELPPTYMSARTLCYRGDASWCAAIKDEPHAGPILGYAALWAGLCGIMTREK